MCGREDMSLAYPVQTFARMESVNDLYWHGDQTVAELLERFDLSRSALYAAVEPLPTGEPCPRCGGTLAFTNRNARSVGRVTCLQCELVVPDRRDDAHDHDHDADDESGDPFGSELAQAAGGMDHRLDALQRELQRERNQRAYALGGAAMLGAAVGAAAAVLIRRG